MINMLISSKDILRIKELFNSLMKSNANIRINKITTTEIEIIEALKEDKDIDVVLITSELTNILNELDQNIQKKYKNSVMTITKNFKEIKEIVNNDMIFDYVIKESNTDELIYKMNRLVENRDMEEKRKAIIKELIYIGYNIEYVGTNYLIDTILEMYKNRELMLDNLQKDIYPLVSKIYNEPIHNIKCNINRATNCMYCECDNNRLKNYFSFYDDVKPTSKMVIYTVLNKII